MGDVVNLDSYRPQIGFYFEDEEYILSLQELEQIITGEIDVEDIANHREITRAIFLTFLEMIEEA